MVLQISIFPMLDLDVPEIDAVAHIDVMEISWVREIPDTRWEPWSQPWPVMLEW